MEEKINSLSENLERIKLTTNNIRSITGTENDEIEVVAQAVSDLNDDNIAKDQEIAELEEEIAELEEEIERITPKGTIDITKNNVINVSSYAIANVKVQDPNIKGICFTDWIEDRDNIIKLNRDEVDIATILAQYDTSIFTSGEEMFKGCKIDSDELINLDTSHMVIMREMFCEASPRDNDVFVVNFDFAEVTDIDSMFHSCGYRIIDLTALKKTIHGMGSICSDSRDLIACYVPNMNITGNFHRFFQGDENLQFVDIRSMEFHTKTNDSGYIFDDVPDTCIVVVKDQIEKDWILGYYPNLDVQTVEEYESHEPWKPSL